MISDGGSANALLDASNRFYTLIPHDFGMKKPPMLDNLELIQVNEKIKEDVNFFLFHLYYQTRGSIQSTSLHKELPPLSIYIQKPTEKFLQSAKA